jgi:chromosome partitioning protein
MTPTVLAVASKKGGVGKTTTAVHLAAHLAYRGMNTLLVDGDALRSATDWSRGGSMPYKVDGTAALITASRYEAVVIDSEAAPTNAEIITLAEHSTRLILPTIPEYQSVSGMLQTVDVLDAAGIPRDRLAVLITMDTRTGTATQEAREALTEAGLLVLSQTIRDTVSFRHASGSGILVRDVRGPAGKLAWLDYDRALDEILSGVEA